MPVSRNRVPQRGFGGAWPRHVHAEDLFHTQLVPHSIHRNNDAFSPVAILCLGNALTAGRSQVRASAPQPPFQPPVSRLQGPFAAVSRDPLGQESPPHHHRARGAAVAHLSVHESSRTLASFRSRVAILPALFGPLSSVPSLHSPSRHRGELRVQLCGVTTATLGVVHTYLHPAGPIFLAFRHSVPPSCAAPVARSLILSEPNQSLALPPGAPPNRPCEAQSLHIISQKRGEGCHDTHLCTLC